MPTKKHRVNLSLTDELYQKIKEQSQNYAMPIATYCTLAVKLYSDRQAAVPTNNAQPERQALLQ